MSFLIGRAPYFSYKCKSMGNGSIQALILFLELTSQTSCFLNDSHPLQGIVPPMNITKRTKKLVIRLCKFWHGPRRSQRNTKILHWLMENLDIFRKVGLNDWRMIEYHFLQERHLCDFYSMSNWIFILNFRFSGAKINNVIVVLFSLNSQV